MVFVVFYILWKIYPTYVVWHTRNYEFLMNCGLQFDSTVHCYFITNRTVALPKKNFQFRYYLLTFNLLRHIMIWVYNNFPLYLTGVFLICWVPFFTCNIMDAMCTKLQYDCQPGVTAFILTTWLGWVEWNQLC